MMNALTAVKRGTSSTRHGYDLERGGGAGEPVQGRARNGQFKIEPRLNRIGNRNEAAEPILLDDSRNGGDINNKEEGEYVGNAGLKDVMYPGGDGESDNNRPEIKCGIRDNPGL
nr:nucleobase-ascorbate transporter 11 [Tanacetum cinerariifolium]